MDSETIDLTKNRKMKSINEEEIRFRYEMEKKAMTAISLGDYTLIEKMLRDEYEGLPFNIKVKRLPDDKLRDRKNAMVIRNTFSRIAAREGGLPPVYLHVLSETYALKIEQADSIDYLDKVLAIQMFKDYCDTVKQFSTLGYSKITEQVVSYISNQLTEGTSLEEAANIVHINAAHLSRKFKKETGFNFNEYVNRHRVEYAKLLFHEGNASITEVASLSGFNSSSYFSKVFKKMTGASPKDFTIQNVQNHPGKD